MFDRKTEQPLLGDEAIPGGLAEIKRRVQASLDAKARHRHPMKGPRSGGRVAGVVRWLRNRFAR